MKNVEAKKMAILKSNAAPEVKLKAIEKLDSVKNNAEQIEPLRKRAVMQWTQCSSLASEIENQIEDLMGALQSTAWDAEDLKGSTNEAMKCLALLKQAKQAIGDY